jgi:acyl carrier protein
MAKPAANQDPQAMYAAHIRPLIAEHARLRTDVDQLADDADLYEAGLTSLSTVNLMLALEEHFDVEFSDRMLGRKTFSSIQSLSDAITELKGPAPVMQKPAPELRA